MTITTIGCSASATDNTRQWRRDRFSFTACKWLSPSRARGYVLQFFSEYPAMGGHPLLMERHGSAMICRIVWEFVEGFLERISRLLGSGGGRKSVPICHCPCEKRGLIGIDARWHNSRCISSYESDFQRIATLHQLAQIFSSSKKPYWSK